MSFIIASSQKIVPAITVGSVKVGGVGNKSVPILYNGKPLTVQLPIVMTWGVETREFDGNSKMTLKMQFPSDNYMTEQISAALENLKEFEAFVKQTAVTNAKEWLNKNTKNPEVIDALYTSMFRYPKNKATQEVDMTQSPTLSVKIPNWDGRINVDVFCNGTLIFPKANTRIEDVLTPKSKVGVLMECGGLWLANGNFGITWRLKQAIVKENQAIPRGVCVMAEETSTKIPESKRTEAKAPPTEFDNDALEVLSDDDLGGSADSSAPRKNRFQSIVKEE